MAEKLTVKVGSSAEFDWLYSDMMRQFPPSELKPKAAFAQMIASGESHFMVAEQNGGVVGYYLYHNAGDVAMLDHIAVLERFHSHGIGTVLMREIARRHAEIKGMFLEVEPPDAANPATIRRIKFYEKCGLYKLPINYLMPAPNSETVKMDIWFLNSDGFGSGKIAPQIVMDAIRALSRRVYGCFESARCTMLENLEILPPENSEKYRPEMPENRA